MSDVSPKGRSITESPWYWVYLFCTAGLIALILSGPKFSVRQAEMERTYQGRQRAVQQATGQAPTTPLSSTGQTAIRLWPLYIVLGSVLVFAWVGLWRSHYRRSRAIALSDGEEAA